jgi:hypothetical protein
VDFPPFLEGRFPKAFIHVLGQINAGVNNARPSLPLCREGWLARSRFCRSSALGHVDCSTRLVDPKGLLKYPANR